MRIHRLTIKNFACYRGTNELELGAQVYAVVAKHADNPDRSNWLGKTTFLETIDFALYGNHRYAKEDMWITRGEDEGLVELVTDDGLTIRRERKRGKATQFFVTDRNQQLRKDEAQARIIQRVGLSSEDYRNTSYFEQRKMARFVTADPGQRMEIIGSWFRLDPLLACEAAVRTRARERLDNVNRIQNQIAAKKSFIEQTASTAGIPVDADQVDAAVEKAASSYRQQIAKHRAVIADLEKEIAVRAVALADWNRVVGEAEEYKRILARGKALKAQSEQLRADLEASPPPSSDEILRLADVVKELTQAQQGFYAALSAESAEEKQKERLSKGEFDGLCPVAGIQCPSKDEINAPRKRNLALFNEAKEKRVIAEKEWGEAQARTRQAQAAHAKAVNLAADAKSKALEIERTVAQLEDLRAQCKRLAPALDRVKEATQPEGDAALRSELQTAKKAMLEAETNILYLERARTGIREARTSLADLEAELKAAADEAAVYREACQIFGRNGAQKRVAEGNILDIETGANELLRTCGIDLTIGVQWAREGNGLATECDACGTPFPASQKVKTCARCGAERGPKLINKLDIVLSDRSGAAEDLAGIAFQLSASAWLRNDRASAWGVLSCDEPFTALDTANRQALARHLATMLRGTYGYEQSFIVAHQREVMESLPARIEISADGNGSKLRVVG